MGKAQQIKAHNIIRFSHFVCIYLSSTYYYNLPFHTIYIYIIHIFLLIKFPFKSLSCITFNQTLPLLYLWDSSFLLLHHLDFCASSLVLLD